MVVEWLHSNPGHHTHVPYHVEERGVLILQTPNKKAVFYLQSLVAPHHHSQEGRMPLRSNLSGPAFYIAVASNQSHYHKHNYMEKIFKSPGIMPHLINQIPLHTRWYYFPATICFFFFFCSCRSPRHRTFLKNSCLSKYTRLFVYQIYIVYQMYMTLSWLWGKCQVNQSLFFPRKYSAQPTTA